MHENRNRRSNKSNEIKGPVILAKREVDPTKTSEQQNTNKPKILLKSKDKEPVQHGYITSGAATTSSSSLSQSQSSGTTGSNIVVLPKETSDVQIHNRIPVMTKPISIMSSSSFHVNSLAHDVLIESNSDFVVVGVIGSQGVGKSTIMNLLTNNSDYNIYDTLIKNQDGRFPIKMKTDKGIPSSPSSPRTESMQMFITKDRFILLDTPPVLCNSHMKDATTSEIDDTQLIIILLSVCHIIIVVQDDYFNLNIMRLLRFAELTKPNHEKIKTLDKLPNILFVKNKAKRNDFLPNEKLKINKMLRYIFKDSQLNIFFGRADDAKTNNVSEDDRNVNYFVFPELKEDGSAQCFSNLHHLADDLRNRVFMAKKTNKLSNTSVELTENIWFDLLCDIANCRNQFFLTSYEDIRRHHSFRDKVDYGGKN